MSHDASIKPLLPGAILALLSILFGFGLGGVFGAAEDAIKDNLRASTAPVFETVYHGDAAKRDAVVSRSWSHLKRAHLHGGAIGTAALAAILLLAMIGTPASFERLTAIALGAGALLYATFWMFAAFKAPAMGGTEAAKESLQFIAIPGAGLAILGILGTIYAAVTAMRSK